MQPVCDQFFEGVELGARSSSEGLTASVRAYLQAAREYLLERHDAGAPARSVNELHAELIDRLVHKLFRVAEDRYFETNSRLNYRIAVVAVGGYGRRELSLGSDIDLLFVHRGKVNAYTETIAETITQRLWDARLVVGHAMRTVPECIHIGTEDVPTLTSYLDSRFLIGDPTLFKELDREVGAYVLKNAREFADAKLEEQRQRHVRKGESLYLLQPDVKEGVGGLRDYHTALWVARAACWDVRDVEHLQARGLLDPDELPELLDALDFHWRLRNELHRKGRKQDRLHYEEQQLMAERLGLSDTPELLAVERLMRRYYLCARTVYRISQRVVERARQLLDNGSGRRASVSYPVAEGFMIAQGRLEIPREELLKERPLRMLAAFAVAQHHDVELSARAQRMLRQNLELIDDAFRTDAQAADLLRQILNSPLRVYRTLTVMNELGVLAAYLPEFAHLVGLWQQDMYHTYTVDVHSLFLVEQLRRIWKGEHREELPLATELIREVRRPFALYLACILHDIGKGKGGGHCQKGSALIPALAERLRLSEDEKELVQFLVLHHLTKSGMADRRDVNDPRTILNLATLCRTREWLRMLYLITVADIRSVSAEAWTSWKHSQMKVLYRGTMEWLEAGAGAEAAPQFFLERAVKRAQSNQQEALAIGERAGVNRGEAEAVLDVMPRRYLLDHTPDEIAMHVSAALDFLASGRDIALYPFGPPDGARNFWGLVILARDRPGLFSAVTGVLAGFGHDVLRAQVYTTRDGLAVEIYQLGPIDGGAAEEHSECERITQRLRSTLAGETPPVRRFPRERVPASALRQRAPSVRISNEESDFYTVIDVATNDRPALLYDITRALSELGLEIFTSRASTRAKRATDSFYVTLDGHKITDPQRIAQIEHALAEAVGQPVSGA